jgi:hypothetical protein
MVSRCHRLAWVPVLALVLQVGCDVDQALRQATVTEETVDYDPDAKTMVHSGPGLSIPLMGACKTSTPTPQDYEPVGPQ